MGIAALILAASLAQAGSGGGYAAFRPGDAALDARMSAAYSACVERSGGVTADMRDCADAEYRRLDVQLNLAYRAAMGRLPAGRRARLQADQRAWLAGKAAMCRRYVRENGEGGGSMDLLLLDECALRELARRTLWLSRYR